MEMSRFGNYRLNEFGCPHARGNEPARCESWTSTIRCSPRDLGECEAMYRADDAAIVSENA
jgi:hypothetical protein